MVCDCACACACLSCAYVCARDVLVCVRACVRACVGACVRACVRALMHAWVRACVRNVCIFRSLSIYGNVGREAGERASFLGWKFTYTRPAWLDLAVQNLAFAVIEGCVVEQNNFARSDGFSCWKQRKIMTPQVPRVSQ